MKIHNLKIERRPTYDNDYPNMLVGTVQMQDDNGKMEIVLSNKTVSEIFSLIKDDVARVAESNASKAGHAVAQAASEAPLLEALA